MKSAILLLLVLPLVASLEVYISNPTSPKTLTTTSTVVTFTFSEQVSGFTEDSVEVVRNGRGDSPTVGSVTRVVNDGEAFGFQQWTVQLSDLMDGGYSVKVTDEAASMCTVSGGSCTVAIGATMSSASSLYEFDVSMSAPIPTLSRTGPAIVRSGGADAMEVKFMLKFEDDVYLSGSGNSGIKATDGSGKELEVRIAEYGAREWTYSVLGENGGSIITFMDTGGAVSKSNVQSVASNSLTTVLNIRMDCVSREVWGKWTACSGSSQTHTNTPIVAVSAMFGGADCNLATTTASRDCVALDAAVSCAARGTGSCSTFTAGQECDCTPDCISNANGVGCCPDVASFCSVGCSNSGCDVMLVDYKADVLCSCDYQCAEFNDCCYDFDSACSDQLCGYKLVEKEITLSDLCSMSYSGAGDTKCFCDHSCAAFGDCCHDYFRVCNVNNMCSPPEGSKLQWENCGKTFQDCGCDILCPYYDDCCEDYGITCAYSSTLPAIDTFVAFPSSIQVPPAFSYNDNPSPPPESCDCVAMGLSTADCCGSQVGYFGRRCSCSDDCSKYGDCCSDYSSVC